MKRKEEIKKLLLVVDMVNGFIKSGNMADPYINHITPKIKEYVDEIIKDDEGLGFICDTHKEDSLEFKKYPVHCLEETEESKVIDELIEYINYGLLYKKNSTSTMYAPGFINDIEQMKNLKEVLITGCCSDICVLNLAIPLTNYFDQNDRNVDVIVDKNAIETYDSPLHNREEYNEMSLKLMKQAGVGVRNE